MGFKASRFAPEGPADWHEGIRCAKPQCLGPYNTCLGSAFFKY